MRPLFRTIGWIVFLLFFVNFSKAQGIQFGYRMLTTDFDRSIGFRPSEQESFPTGVGLQFLSPYTPYFALGADIKVAKIHNANDELIQQQEGKLLYNLSALARVQKMTAGGWFKPFFQGGLGIINTRPETRWNPMIQAGAGVDLEILPGLLVGVSTSYSRELVRNRYHMEYAIGVSIPIGRPESREVEKELQEVMADNVGTDEDKDGDGVADFQDDCPLAAGSVLTKGCPDKDEDGIPDSDDACPDQPGLIGNGGCPIFDPVESTHPITFKDSSVVLRDSQFVKSADSLDLDTDGDGIPDEYDECPEIYGTISLGGCPASDRDNDGVSDEKDRCPDEFGSIYNDGCPEEVTVEAPSSKKQDTQDPVISGEEGSNQKVQAEDSIATEATELINEVADSEEDVIEQVLSDSTSKIAADTDMSQKSEIESDDLDKPGEQEPEIITTTSTNKETPDLEAEQSPTVVEEKVIVIRETLNDRDGDGIADHIDPCPDLAGSLSNKGCPPPVINEELNQSNGTEEVVDMDGSETSAIGSADFEFAPMIHFQSGVAVLQRRYIPELEKIAAFLRLNSGYKVRIYGHTDSEGSQYSNDFLSRKRAKACYTFLTVAGGIEAERIDYFGQGEGEPISDNSTARGRYKNRRVVFDFIRK